MNHREPSLADELQTPSVVCLAQRHPTITHGRDRHLGRSIRPPKRGRSAHHEKRHLVTITDQPSDTATRDTDVAITRPPTTHAELVAWVAEIEKLTTPDRVHWVDGSPTEHQALIDGLVSAGTFVALAQRPNSYWCASDPSDVARVEDRTFICSPTQDDAGPTNNWADPAEMRDTLTKLFSRSMRGRTMYVIPFVMGHLDAEHPM